jgi:hypothetical protein
MAVSTDGGTLFLTNFASHSLQAIDVHRLPMQFNSPQVCRGTYLAGMHAFLRE